MSPSPRLLMVFAALLVGCGSSVDVTADVDDASTSTDDGVEASGDETNVDASVEETIVDSSTDTAVAETTTDSGADTSAPDTSIDTAPETLTCASTEKICAGACVPKTAAATGCAGTSCAACPTDTHGSATCTSEGACAISCDSGWKLCGGTCASKSEPASGCGGTSCTACAMDPNGTAICTSAGACSLSCDFGYHLCGSSCAAIGPTSCGTSCTVCPVPANSSATCTAGTCGSACLTGYADCNGNSADGCERNLQTDGANCGACGHSCAGDACVAGMCVPKTLAVGQNDPSDLAVDATDVYWSNTGANQVNRVPKVGGTATVFSSTISPFGIALDDTHVYWTQWNTPGAVLRAAKSGGPAEIIASSQYYAYRLILSGSNVYFIGDSTAGFLRVVPKTGGTVVELQSASSPKGLAFDGTKIFWTAWNEIRKADPVALAPPTKLSTSEQFPAALAIDDSDVFWVDRYANTLRKTSKTGGTITTLATLAYGAQHGALAVDATHVYFLDPKANTVRKIPKTGGAATTIATANDPRGLTIDATFVYWSNTGDGTIMRVAK